MNASRHAAELVGEELVQAEPAALLTLFEEPPELPPELPVPEALMATVAAVGLPKSAAPTTEVKTTLKLLPAAVCLTGTEIDFAEVSPSAQVTLPLEGEKSAPAVAVPFTVL